jgi:hypothetical protein
MTRPELFSMKKSSSVVLRLSNAIEIRKWRDDWNQRNAARTYYRQNHPELPSVILKNSFLGIHRETLETRYFQGIMQLKQGK